MADAAACSLARLSQPLSGTPGACPSTYSSERRTSSSSGRSPSPSIASRSRSTLISLKPVAQVDCKRSAAAC